MNRADDYIEMKSGIKIPTITVFDDNDDLLNIAPSEALKLLQNGLGEIDGEEAEEIDNQIFFFADHFVKDAKMLKEITSATDIKVKFKHI